MNIRVTSLLCILLFSLPLFARDNTDVVVMNNGDHITCEIKGLSAGVLSVKLSYAQGTIGLEWAKVAHLESNQLFLIQTEAGPVYTGKLSANEGPGGRAVKIEIASAPEKQVEISQSQVVKLNQTAESFWRRFNGGVNTGILYSKGNETTQYNVASQVEYLRPRWSSQASFNSSFAHNSGANNSTRNQAELGVMRLLPWNNWFYSGTGNFLQSSVQGINLQTSIGGGIGRYLRNSNESSFYILGGIAWQNVQYKNYTADQGAQNTATGLVAAELKMFKFKKTDLDLMCHHIPGDLGAGACPGEYQRFLLHQALQRSVMELFVLWQLGQSAAPDAFRQRLRDQLRT